MVSFSYQLRGYELPANSGAGNGIRTRDPNLGKVVLYQLSYSRILSVKVRSYLSEV